MSVIAGLAILVPAYVLAGAATTGLLNAYDSGVGNEALLAIHEFSASATEIFFAAGSVLSLGFGPLLWGLAGRQTRTIPTWMSRLALLVGTTGLVWALPPSEHPIPTVLVLVNVLGSFVLFGGLSRALLRTA